MKTTNEKAREDNHDNLVNNLQELLEKNYDAEKGFTKAMTDAKTPQLKSFLKQQAVQRSRFATELTNEIINLNEEPKEKGSFAGDLHRTWIDVKSAFTGHDDEAILEECIRGEKASWDEYEDKLKHENFPPKIAEVVQKQATEIYGTLKKVRMLEDIADH